MIEKNRDILSDAINKMPLRKPKASNWQGIAAGLDQLATSAFMAKNASSLPRHKAPAGAWSKVAAGLPPASGAFFASVWGKIIIGSLIIGSLSAIYLLTIYPGDDIPIREPEEKIISLPPVKKATSPEVINEANTLETVIENEPQHILESYPAGETTNEGIEEVAYMQVPPGSEPLSSPPDRQRHDLERLSLKEKTSLTVNESKDLNNKTFRSVENNYETVEYAKDLSRSQIKAGLYYSFKRYQDAGRDDMSVPRNLSSFGFDLSFEKYNWIFKAGLEYLSWKEKGGVTYDYDQNQLVYQYHYVDSAHVNNPGGGITYFTTETFVYDSVHGQMGGEMINDYNVLQVPLMVGYKIMDKGRVRISFLGGAGFDINLSGNQFIPEFDKEDATLTRVSQNLAYRTVDNWRLILGFDISYRFERKWELYTEPGYQWYMKPLYSAENTGGFGLFNIKLGVRYVF